MNKKNSNCQCQIKFKAWKPSVMAYTAFKIILLSKRYLLLINPFVSGYTCVFRANGDDDIIINIAF